MLACAPDLQTTGQIGSPHLRFSRWDTPAPDFDVAAINAQSLVKNGYENFGYWNFFAKDEAAKVIEEHVSELDIVGCNRVRTDNC